ncbi:MAG: PD-(D/E)XK nuclease family transposase [Bulleidia sp.]|nr:PD-(D/E)XK nuclease family transposase [Bulleidia sp.]
MSEYKKFEELTIIDDWMFRTVMAEDPEAARMIMSAVLDEEISTVEKVTEEKSDQVLYKGREVIMDAYFKDKDGKVFDLDMQQKYIRWLITRMLVYLSGLVMKTVKPGKYPEHLKAAVVFICDFDFFHLGWPVYRFRLHAEPPEGIDGEGVWIPDVEMAILNLKGNPAFAGAEVKEIQTYFNEHIVTGPISARLDEDVRRVKEDQEKMSMYLHEMDRLAEEREEGISIGEAQGEVRGIAKGEERGMLKALAGFVNDHLCSLSDAAKRAGMTSKEFKEKAKEFLD